MAKDTVKASRKVGKQSIQSDVSSAEEALAQVGKVSPIKPPKSLILAQNEPKTVQGYENLGTGGLPRTGKATAKDNRGEGV